MVSLPNLKVFHPSKFLVIANKIYNECFVFVRVRAYSASKLLIVHSKTHGRSGKYNGIKSGEIEANPQNSHVRYEGHYAFFKLIQDILSVFLFCVSVDNFAPTVVSYILSLCHCRCENYNVFPTLLTKITN